MRWKSIKAGESIDQTGNKPPFDAQSESIPPNPPKTRDNPILREDSPHQTNNIEILSPQKASKVLGYPQESVERGSGLDALEVIETDTTPQRPDLPDQSHLEAESAQEPRKRKHGHGTQGRPKTHGKSRKVNGKKTKPYKIAAINALREQGIPTREIARELHVSQALVCSAPKLRKHDPKAVESMKKELSGYWLSTAHRALDHITDDKLRSASAPALGMLAGISTDKFKISESFGQGQRELEGVDDATIQGEIDQLKGELSALETNPAVKALNTSTDNMVEMMQHGETL